MRRPFRTGPPLTQPNLELYWRTRKLIEEIRCKTHRKHPTIEYPDVTNMVDIIACCNETLDDAEAVARIHYGLPKAETIN